MNTFKILEKSGPAVSVAGSKNNSPISFRRGAGGEEKLSVSSTAESRKYPSVGQRPTNKSSVSKFPSFGGAGGGYINNLPLTIISLLLVFGSLVTNAQVQQISEKSYEREKVMFTEHNQTINDEFLEYNYIDIISPRTINKGKKSSTNGSKTNWYEPDTINIFTFKQGWGDRRRIYTYNSQGKAIFCAEEEWENNDWIDYFQMFYAYDSNDNLVTALYKRYENGNWADRWRNNYTYDNNNNMLTLFSDIFPPSSSGWQSYSKEYYTYDSNNNMLTYVSQSGNTTQIDSLTYDNSNRILTHTSKFGIIIWRFTYTYDNNNNILSKMRERYINNDWQNDKLYTYTYDNNNNLLTETQVNDKKYTYSYDNNNNCILAEHWKWESSSWQNKDDDNIILPYNNMHRYIEFMHDYIYVGSHKLTASYIVTDTITTQLYSVGGTITYNGVGLAGVNIAYTLNPAKSPIITDENGYYEIHNIPANTSITITPTKEGYTFTPPSYTVNIGENLVLDFTVDEIGIINSETIKNISIYPNPATNILHFSEATSFEITDIQGKSLLKSEKEVKFANINNLQAGIYFVKVGNQTQKFVKSLY